MSSLTHKEKHCFHLARAGDGKNGVGEASVSWRVTAPTFVACKYLRSSAAIEAALSSLALAFLLFQGLDKHAAAASSCPARDLLLAGISLGGRHLRPLDPMLHSSPLLICRFAFISGFFISGFFIIIIIQRSALRRCQLSAYGCCALEAVALLLSVRWKGCSVAEFEPGAGRLAHSKLCMQVRGRARLAWLPTPFPSLSSKPASLNSDRSR